jgi:hypothetical protein
LTEVDVVGQDKEYMYMGILSSFLVLWSSLLFAGPSTVNGSDYKITAVLNAAGVQQELKSWTVRELSGLKQVSSKEKEPRSGKIAPFRGVVLSVLIDDALRSLTPEHRAQIDSVLLKSEAGDCVMIPRAFVIKYPMFLALSSPSSDLGALGPVYSVVPWTTRPRVMDEDGPVANYFVPRVQRIELANSRELYNGFFLSRRTDPAAMRGEKIFVKHCAACQSCGKAAAVTKTTIEECGQRLIKGAFLKEKEQRAVSSYLEAFRGENGSPSLSN